LFKVRLAEPSAMVPPSGGSLEIGKVSPNWLTQWLTINGSPFGGIPRNWKVRKVNSIPFGVYSVPPSGGSLEIGKVSLRTLQLRLLRTFPLRGDP